MLFLVQELLEWASRWFKVPIDQVQFIFCMLFSLPLGAIYRTLLHPKRASPNLRLAVSITWGFCIAWICFRTELLRLIAICALYYGLTWSLSPREVHKIVFVVSLVVLSAAQIWRMVMEYGLNRLDYTGRLMIITQKVTYVAFSLHDGLARKEEMLTKEQKQQRIKRVPTFLEYFGYLFHHSMLLVGPVCTFKEYMDFIEGRDVAETGNKDAKEPSPMRVVLVKLLSALVFMVSFAVLSKALPIEQNADPVFIASSPFLWRVLYAYVSIVIQRFKYYFAWIIADAGNNACGLGFNGYDSDGRAQWNRMTNVNVFNVETGTNFRDLINNWNIQTSVWLRRTVYERVPYQKTLLTFSVSAIWHGFYPGYYLCATAAGLFTVASRAFRRSWGHVFQSTSPIQKRLSEFLMWFLGNFILCTYVMMTFLLLRLDLGLEYYRSMFYLGHILFVGALVVCRGTRSKLSRHASRASEHTTENKSSETSNDAIDNSVEKTPSYRTTTVRDRFSRKHVDSEEPVEFALSGVTETRFNL